MDKKIDILPGLKSGEDVKTEPLNAAPLSARGVSSAANRSGGARGAGGHAPRTGRTDTSFAACYLAMVTLRSCRAKRSSAAVSSSG